MGVHQFMINYMEIICSFHVVQLLFVVISWQYEEIDLMRTFS